MPVPRPFRELDLHDDPGFSQRQFIISSRVSAHRVRFSRAGGKWQPG
jgi:hypothetical protein